jgi:hypothetical protein
MPKTSNQHQITETKSVEERETRETSKGCQHKTRELLNKMSRGDKTRQDNRINNTETMKQENALN